MAHNIGDEANDYAYRQLVKLGDMMGDGLHLEPGGAWISKEYKRLLNVLGLLPKTLRNTSGIDDFMAKRTKTEKCSCGGNLKQTRKGSFVAKCVICGNKYRLGDRQTRKKERET